MNAAEFSIVIPACNEGEWVRRTLEAVQARRGRHSLEIIVVDDGSSDGCCDFLRGPARAPSEVRLISGSDLGVAGARNTGAAAARGECLVFLDAHVLPEPEWLDELAALLASPAVGLAGLAVRTHEGPPATGYVYTFTDENWTVEWRPAPGSAPYEVPAVVGCCCAARRQWFEQIGSFDPMHVKYGLEDVELSLRAWFLGYTCVVSPRAQVVHRFRTSADRGFSFSWDEYDQNLLRYMLTYLSGRRLKAVLRGVMTRESARRALVKLASDDAFWSWREGVQRRFVHDDEWYFRKFASYFSAFERRLEDISNREAAGGGRLRAAQCDRCGAVSIGPDALCLRCGHHLTSAPEPAEARELWRLDLAVAADESGVCGNCGAPLRKGAGFCTQCRAPAARPRATTVCSNCGAALRPGKQFCVECGFEAAHEVRAEGS